MRLAGSEPSGPTIGWRVRPARQYGCPDSDFDVLFSQSRLSMVRTAAFLLGDTSAAEDVVQDAYGALPVVAHDPRSALLAAEERREVLRAVSRLPLRQRGHRTGLGTALLPGAGACDVEPRRGRPSAPDGEVGVPESACDVFGWPAGLCSRLHAHLEWRGRGVGDIASAAAHLGIRPPGPRSASRRGLRRPLAHLQRDPRHEGGRRDHLYLGFSHWSCPAVAEPAPPWSCPDSRCRLPAG